MAYHDDVKDIPEGNFDSLLIEEPGKVKSTRKGNL